MKLVDGERAVWISQASTPVGRDGRVGVVLRKGEALLVERTGGRAIVITVDEAAQAAGLLNALADRARTAG